LNNLQTELIIFRAEVAGFPNKNLVSDYLNQTNVLAALVDQLKNQATLPSLAEIDEVQTRFHTLQEEFQGFLARYKEDCKVQIEVSP
jgi:predicted extracellular nuclease